MSEHSSNVNCDEPNQKINARYSGRTALNAIQSKVVIFKSNVPLPVSVQFRQNFGPPNTCKMEITLRSECGDVVEILNGSATLTIDSIVLAALSTTEVTIRCLECVSENECIIDYDLTIGSNNS